MQHGSYLPAIKTGGILKYFATINHYNTSKIKKGNAD